MSAVASLPRVELYLNSGLLSDFGAAALEEVQVHKALSMPAVCELRFALSGNGENRTERFRIGESIELKLAGSSAPLFSGEITAVEFAHGAANGQTLRLRCYDRLHRLRRRQPVRVHVQLTPAELAQELVIDLGIEVKPAEDGPLSPWRLQYRQSDLQLLEEVCRPCGLYFTLRCNVLHLLTLEGEDETIPLRVSRELLEARLELNAESTSGPVTVNGWSVGQVQVHEGRVDAPRIGRAMGARFALDKLGAEGERSLNDRVLADDVHATAQAQGELDARATREQRFQGTCVGNPALQPGSRITVSGAAGTLDGSYVLTSVTHQINHITGFTSEVSTLLPQPPTRDGGAVVAWGTITSVDDPENLGRVRAVLPAIGKVETDWMGVMAAGAGSSKGLVILPDIDDHVLILFVGGDPSHSVVLGGIYGGNGPGDYGVEGASVRRYFVGTSGGQKIRLDDAKQLIRLENQGGSFVEFSPEKFLLHSSVPLEIEAPGQDVVIRGKTIDFRQA